MKVKHIRVGTTKYSWVSYKPPLLAKEENVQAVEWPNGEGVTVFRNDDSSIDFSWNEWDAIKLAIRKLKSA